MKRRKLATSSAWLFLSTACAMPLVFAQQAPPPTNETGAQQQSADAATQAAAPTKKTWSELDVDRNGSLSKSEASEIPALQAVFDQADSNADGALTEAEYKAWVAAKGESASDTQK